MRLAIISAESLEDLYAYTGTWDSDLGYTSAFQRPNIGLTSASVVATPVPAAPGPADCSQHAIELMLGWDSLEDDSVLGILEDALLLWPRMAPITNYILAKNWRAFLTMAQTAHPIARATSLI
ncbi:hypothetical protein R3P38DRAFT_3191827 [Favolaschia claudopus]|uniref:Uncharacterized protein n=1 Tax=Favolaschia claudopus TaxID=2862362 RepID=A0AAW0BJP5_9AGAR